MSISNKIDQKERRAVLKNDQQSAPRPNDHEPSTMFQMANLGVDTSVSSGRSGKDYVAGSELAVQYPAASGPWSSDYARLPDEPALGFSVEAQEANGTPAEIVASLPVTLAGKQAEGDSVPPVAFPSAASSTAVSASASDQAPKWAEQPVTIHSAPAPPTLTRPRRRL